MNVSSHLTHLECPLTGETFDADFPHRTNPSNGKPLLARYDLESARATLTPNSTRGREPSMWRYREVLPLSDASKIISLGEGWTPLIPALRLGSRLGMDRLFVKDEGVNPTGSFKARGLSAAISRAHELGLGKFTMPSAGNAAGAMSAYTAARGLEAHVFMPKDAPDANIAECLAFGADVHLIDGFITDAGAKSAAAAESNGWFDVSTLREPYRVEGKKTMGYEIVEQLGYEVPDVIIYPTGGGTGIVGIWKALGEMEALGWLGPERPRMISVQAEGCAPIASAFEAGTEFAEPFANPSTLAAGMRVPAAIGDFLILRALRESGGMAVTVTDAEMVGAVHELASTEGVFAAPEGGATLAALRKLVDSGSIDPAERVVLLNTGNAYKYLDMMPGRETD